MAPSCQKTIGKRGLRVDASSRALVGAAVGVLAAFDFEPKFILKANLKNEEISGAHAYFYALRRVGSNGYYRRCSLVLKPL